MARERKITKDLTEANRLRPLGKNRCPLKGPKRVGIRHHTPPTQNKARISSGHPLVKLVLFRGRGCMAGVALGSMNASPSRPTPLGCYRLNPFEVYLQSILIVPAGSVLKPEARTPMLAKRLAVCVRSYASRPPTPTPAPACRGLPSLCWQCSMFRPAIRAFRDPYTKTAIGKNPPPSPQIGPDGASSPWKNPYKA